jgi:MFS family permease
MGGLLVTSIISGQLISRFGRYKPFPITGTALVAVALFSLSHLAVDTPTWQASAGMLLLGLGLGMVMQVLVLAAQNAVDYRLLGVATSGSTLFRQVGGSIGVAVFGAIFANRLGSELARRLPPGAHAPAGADPHAIAALPAPIHEAYVAAFAAALRPVFLAAAVVSLAAFGLTWLLREVPLRRTAAAEGVGETFASPRDDDSHRELERALSVLAARENRWDFYDRLRRRAGSELSPPALWLLARIADREPVPPDRLAEELDPQGRHLAPALAELTERGLLAAGGDGSVRLTPAGRAEHEALVSAGRASVGELAEGWDPEEHPEVRALLERLGAALVSEFPERSPR